MNPVSLKFDSPDIEKAFWEDNAQRSLKLIRFSLMLAFILYALFGTLDHWVVPGAAHEILIIRIVVCALLLTSYIYTFFPSFKKFLHPVMSILSISAGLGIVAMVLVAEEQGGYYYYAGLLLVFFWTHTLLRQRFIWASVETWLILAVYYIVAAGMKHTPSLVLISNSFFLVSSNIIGMIVSYSFEFYLKKVFWQTQMLEENRKKLAAENSRKTRELEAARRLQLSMLPQEIPEHRSIEFAAFMETATEVGGDYYDFCLSEDGMLTMAIGDATGHGAQAGAMVAAVKILFTDLVNDENLQAILDKSNNVLRRVGSSNTYMAMAYCRIRNLSLEMAGAGMPPALIYRHDAKCIEQISLSGLPLGSPVYLPYQTSTVNLLPLDTVIFMSDGFPELFNASGEMFGYERTAEIFKEAAVLSPKEIIDCFKNTAKQWLNGIKNQDDITFIVMKVKPDAVKQ